jgi:CSLREA domain-containing protein
MKRLRTASLAAALLLGSLASTASANPITPSTTSDDITNNGNCTLREAVQAANTDTSVDQCPAGSGPDTIQLGNGIYDLTITGAREDANQTGDLDVTGASSNRAATR